MSFQVYAQRPVVKVDFDFSGRKVAEVNEPGYESWVISEENLIAHSFAGVDFSIRGDVRSNWYKAGIQAPYYARLSSDGVVGTGKIEMTLSGLPEGEHSLLTFHNTFDNPENHQFSPIDIYVNDELIINDLVPSNRAESSAETASSFLTFSVKKGEAVTIKMENDPKSSTSVKELIWNGFELNTPNIKKQAKLPFPEDGDEHVVIENELMLKWEAANEAVAHEVYFGKDLEQVASGQPDSEVYKGKVSSSEFPVSKLYSMDNYYWRVDEVDQEGNTTKGDVWYFRPAQLAFKGAEGYGRFARGGRGGKVITVTNLNDDGPGSLREAVTQDIGPRTIVFAVGGTIELKSRLVINQPYITLAGQTAPGKGIMIAQAPLGLTGNDGIVRFIRVGIGAGRTYDGMGLTGANHSIMDHCSIRWTIDESFSSRGAHNITLQRTLIAEALNVADHGKYEAGKMHGYAATIGGDIGSFHHNLLAHCYGRNWSMGGGLDGNGYSMGRLDIRNNVVYNWGKRSTDGGAHEVNFVNNYYKPGPSTVFFLALKAQHEGVGLGTQQYYFSGNVMPGYFGLENQEDGRMIEGEANYKTYVDTPFFPSYVATHSAKEAYQQVLSDVGANQPVLDDHDLRIIQETKDSTFHFRGSKSGMPGMPDTEQDVGGWEKYPEVKRQEDWDSDSDGLPDWWEIERGLDPNSTKGDFSDSNQDNDRDGFTQLDDYLDWMAQPHYFLESGEQLLVDLSSLFRGFTNEPLYSLVSGKATVDHGFLKFKDGESGLKTVVVKVSDQNGYSMTRQLEIYIKRD
ncbi:T9SS C-terminal target domain-containing protein [Echinicola sp. 20G]|uniref:T9SS C-terminal target domain-containing protein n=1 Tax=Echinicola sp. 20G TaxID=2781961 RepID=UPI001F1627AE|nr:T9SS C-terminal target domain-containing protein [Echinicola sp. 20G]